MNSTPQRAWTYQQLPKDMELDEHLDEQAAKVFQKVDVNLDLEQQMKYDPSGFLTTFWAEQRKVLNAPSARARRWNPQVRCVY